MTAHKTTPTVLPAAPPTARGTDPAGDTARVAARRANTLRERARAFVAIDSAAIDSASEFDGEKAAKRYARWRRQEPFRAEDSTASGDALSRRLALDGLTEESFVGLLGARDESFEEWPRWGEVERAYRSPRPTGESWDFAAPSAEFAALLPAVAPLLTYALAARRERLASIHARARPGLFPDDPRALEPFVLQSLPERLVGMASRTLILEMHVARLEERLAGTTPEERFLDWCAQLARPETMLQIFTEYPVLARQLWLRTETWLDAGIEVLDHLVQDAVALEQMFSPDAPLGQLTALAGGQGDRHRGGREVMIATFATVATVATVEPEDRLLRIVYKPRPMAVDVRFQALLAWLDERGQEPPFGTVRVLDCSGAEPHGWMEFIAQAPCATADEARRFFERQGGYLALLYALDASDFHSENLIAAGERPVLIDLESLFQAPVDGMDAKQADLVAAHVLGRSVLRVGLLPQRVWGNAQDEGVDLSGLGGEGGQLAPLDLPYWAEAGTDAMFLARHRETIEEAAHRPYVEGRPLSAFDYADDIEAGFVATYRRWVSLRNELLADDGPIRAFAEVEVRTIVRPTQQYSTLLSESFHPDLLRDALDRDRHFDKLWLAAGGRPFLERLIASEHLDLWRGDVPYFRTRPDSRDLVACDGTVIPDLFDRSGLDVVMARIAELGEDDLEQQRWVMRASLVALTVDLHSASWPSYTPRLEAQGAISTSALRERLLAQVRRVADHLERRAVWSRGETDEATWIGLYTEFGRHPELAPTKLDLYGGTPGIALFLAQAAQTLGEPRLEALARAAVAGLRRLVHTDPSLVTCVGGFGGWGGLIYLDLRLAELWGDDGRSLREAEHSVAALRPMIERDSSFDFLAGVAGCIPPLLALVERTGSEAALAAALACGNRLLETAVATGDGGLGWVIDAEAQRPWGGLAHGSAGCALALLLLAQATDDRRYREAALAAFRYERSLYVPEVGNWRDARDLDQVRIAQRIGDETFMSAWCHGSAGIGMARLAGWNATPAFGREAVRKEIDAAIRDVRTNGFGQNHCLCHGDLGNLELYLLASEILGDQDLEAEAQARAFSIVQSLEEHGWLCGVALGVEVPGLMTGLAGIGYGLLRAADPTAVPSVLTLASR